MTLNFGSSGFSLFKLLDHSPSHFTNLSAALWTLSAAIFSFLVAGLYLQQNLSLPRNLLQSQAPRLDTSFCCTPGPLQGQRSSS
ncbi:hypothetical protein ACRRTK_009645 [Alexandromys fortis]